MNSNGIRIGLIIFAILYCISPIDAFPGPIDDIIVALLTTVVQRRLSSGSSAD